MRDAAPDAARDVARDAARDVPERRRAFWSSSVLIALTFLSGAAALVFETLWFRQAGLAFGNSVWAASLVLSAFMAGMALGNGWAGRSGDRFARPVRVYALLELATAASGVALVYALPQLGRWLAPLSGALFSMPLALNAARLCVAFALLLVPATAMGMTLPLLTRALGVHDANFGRVLGLLYGANTLGAVAGTLLTEVALLEWFGIRGSAWCAAGCSAVAGAGALALSRGAFVAAPAAPAPALPERTSATRRLLAAAFLSGFALLALEVVWLRFLSLFINDTPAAFALILAVVLAGIALGGLLASVWSGMSARAPDCVALVAYAAGLLGVLGYRVYPMFLQRFYEPDQTAGSVLAIAAGLVLPTALASGALFTLLGAALRRDIASDARASGRLALFNTAGAGVGSIVAGFVLLPWFGMEKSLFGLFALYGATGLLLPGAALPARLRHASGAVFACGLLLFPFGEMRSTYIDASARRWMRPGDEIAEVREGLTATLVHVVHRLNGLPLFDQLATNAYSMTVNDFAARRYMKLFVELPAAVHPRIANALVIGYGIGNTAEALVANDEVERIDVVDIARDILQVSRSVTPPGGTHPLDDPRVHVQIEDGRHFLESTTRRFDLITGEPPPPVMAGVVNLYTREYFELMRARLSEGGIASYWLPMMNISASTGKSLIRAFCEAFDDCSLWHGSARNFMLLGTRSAAARAAVSEQRFVRGWSVPARSAELRAIGLELPVQVPALFIGDAPYLQSLTADSLPLCDDWPERIHQPGTREQRDALILEFRDTQAARARFASSAFIAKLLPESIRIAGQHQFENQRLINDLLFPERTAARQTRVLHQVLNGTPLRFPVLLLLGSDPDIQRALSAASPSQRARSEWLVHRVAERLAERDYRAALELVDAMPPAAVPLDDLRAYLAFAVERAQPTRTAVE